MAGFYDWIDERTGIRKISRAILEEPIRGGARWAYVFGSALVFLFLLQAATGIFLTMYYVPSADHAHVSVAYIQKVVPMGRIIRGLHSYGASAMIIILIAHLVQTYLFGAYKQRRELLWIVGVLMMFVVLGFAFTGYLLPWDQEAHFGTKVGTSVVGEIPIAGEAMQRILLGGHDLTTLTLSRFFVVHAFLLPLALMLLVVLHLHLFRRAGAAGPFHHRDDARVEPFYPHQLFKDMVFIFGVFLVLLILSMTTPPRLGPPADPTSDFLARPPWYFLPLFQLLKYFPGKLALLPTVGLPTVLFGALFLLPFLDRRPERHPLRRPIAIGALALALGGSVVLGALSKYQDATHPEFSAKLRAQEEEAMAFSKAPFVPQEIGRSIPVNPPVVKNPPVVGSRVLKIYFANCANCHGADAMGGTMAPALVKLAKNRRLDKSSLVDYLVGHEREPAPGSMPGFKQLAPEDRDAIAEWLLALDRPIPATESEAASAPTPPAKKITRAKPVRQAEVPTPALPPPPAAFTAHCAFCHGPRGEGKIGPQLIGIAEKPNRRPEDLLKLLTDPRAYGLKDPMPARFPQLSDEDRRQIVEWLSALKRR